MRTALLLIALLALAGSMMALGEGWAGIGISTSNEGSQAISDTSFNVTVAHPAYVKYHPKVLFDEAHNNPYTALGIYKPFADLITSDGYTVVPNKRTFSRKSLIGYRVLVIVNASGPQARRDSSPFTEGECNAVRDWVSAGGALLLVTDQPPFSAAVAKLSERFDLSFTNGYTIETSHYNKATEDQTELVFTRQDGLVGEHPITRGRDSNEQINRIVTFAGTSLKAPAGSVAILKLASTARDVLPPDIKPTPDNPSPDHKTVSAAGRSQAAALKVGNGRVVVLGEAAMLTAQVAPRGFRFGMNVADNDNRQLALNIMHWLAGLLR